MNECGMNEEIFISQSSCAILYVFNVLYIFVINHCHLHMIGATVYMYHFKINVINVYLFQKTIGQLKNVIFYQVEFHRYLKETWLKSHAKKIIVCCVFDIL